MTLQIKTGDIGFALDINQNIIRNYNAWIDGVDISIVSNSMKINLTDGTLLFKGSKINTNSVTLTIDPSDSTKTRRDLIVFNGTDFEILKGTAVDESNVIANPPDYDINNYVVIALVRVAPGVTQLDESDVKDYRIKEIKMEKIKTIHPFLFM